MEINNSLEHKVISLNEVPLFKKNWTTPDVEIIGDDTIASGVTPSPIPEASALPQFKQFYHS